MTRKDKATVVEPAEELRKLIFESRSQLVKYDPFGIATDPIQNSKHRYLMSWEKKLIVGWFLARFIVFYGVVLSVGCTYSVIVWDCSHHHDINLYVVYNIMLRFSSWE